MAEHLDVIGLFNFARGESGKTRKKGRKIGAASVVVAAVATALSRRSFSKTAAEVAIKNVSWPLARSPARPTVRPDDTNNNLSEEGSAPAVVPLSRSLPRQEEGEQRRPPPALTHAGARLCQIAGKLREKSAVQSRRRRLFKWRAERATTDQLITVPIERGEEGRS